MFKKRYDDQTLRFMSDVDSAAHRTGSRLAYLLSLFIMLLLVSFVVWAKIAVLDEVTRGIGLVIPSTYVQVIQNLEGGIVDEIHVYENQLVEKGELLIKLRNSLSAGKYRESLHRAEEHRAAIMRLEAEIQQKPLVFKDGLSIAQTALDMQLAIFNTRKEKLNAELQIFSSQIDQFKQELIKLESKTKHLRKSIANIQKQIKLTKPLVEQKLSSEVDYLAMENDLLAEQGELDEIRFQIPKTEQLIEETRQKMTKHHAEFRAIALSDMNRRRGELRALHEIIAAGEDLVTRTEVRSPVRGTVKQMNVTTIGGVVKPGEPILEIVPVDDTLLVEAKIRPSDIAFIRPGQHASIKITAYDFSIYGGLDGEVEQIGADAIQDARGDIYFRIKLRTTSNAIQYQGENLPIIPGMVASVDILTGKKSVLDYLLKPILKAKQNALRER